MLEFSIFFKYKINIKKYGKLVAQKNPFLSREN